MVMMAVISPKKVKDVRDMSNAVENLDVKVKTLKTGHTCSWMTSSRLLC